MSGGGTPLAPGWLAARSGLAERNRVRAEVGWKFTERSKGRAGSEGHRKGADKTKPKVPQSEAFLPWVLSLAPGVGLKANEGLLRSKPCARFITLKCKRQLCDSRPGAPGVPYLWDSRAHQRGR